MKNLLITSFSNNNKSSHKKIILGKWCYNKYDLTENFNGEFKKKISLKEKKNFLIKSNLIENRLINIISKILNEYHNINFNKKQWKIIYLGASQYNWNNIKIKNNFYKARNTTGSFGILLHNSVFKILLKKYEEYNNPVDHCLIIIQELYSEEVYVSYPNLCIANLESSNIGSVRNNELWASRFRWNLNKYLF